MLKWQIFALLETPKFIIRKNLSDRKIKKFPHECFSWLYSSFHNYYLKGLLIVHILKKNFKFLCLTMKNENRQSWQHWMCLCLELSCCSSQKDFLIHDVQRLKSTSCQVLVICKVGTLSRLAAFILQDFFTFIPLGFYQNAINVFLT